MVSNTPIIAIVGRPNVGKSSLFNRYLNKQRVLVDDRPGITRDRVVAAVEVLSRRILIADTAGLDSDVDTDVDQDTQIQAQMAVREADAILLVVDGKGGLLPEDQAIARELRRMAKPIVVAVNKVDAPTHESRVGEFFELGIDIVKGVSAAHGRGAWDILESLVEKIPDLSSPSLDTSGEPKVAIVGRPNVGKSSLVNHLLGATRVVVSTIPGTTRDSVDIRIVREERGYTFVDTAGLRRPGRRNRPVEAGSALMSIRALERADVALVLIDAAEGVTEQDVRILALSGEHGCASALLVNKWDLMEKEPLGIKQRFQAELDRRLRGFPDYPVLRTSAKTGKGIPRLFPIIRQLFESADRQVATAELNRWLQRCVALHEPSMAQKGSRRRPVKFFYATQTGTRPPRITLFCSDPDNVMPTYVRFLKNQFREQFGVAGVSVRMELRERRSEANS